MDEEILSLLANFWESLQALTLEFQRLKDTTYQLYKKNEELKRENENLKKLLFAKGEAKGKEAQPQVGAGYANLARLYDEGFHICHLNFAEKRHGDCLFCQKLLEGPENEE
ncbi:DNA replication initiation control protein YabA [Anoxybacter fermentans]|uniref:DNA replication initiation control protein YabA n=1 Tax=Anoxybacter fermentans TaxID=1323375 RepID=A0A3S9T1H2_9FIRM|nr:initiation control protein YabA [Anoxybacter fermentans]AZR74418.1 DNA replication initiation control protein YabA [Anoxybacter fermentans]